MEYQHGGDIYSQDIQMDYSANINPLGMPEAVRQALRDCLEREVCSLYPDSRCKKLRQALGRHHGVEEQWIICGNGAADLIFGLAAALRPVRGLVTAPAFSEYEQALRSVGCRTDYYYLREDRGCPGGGRERRALRCGVPVQSQQSHRNTREKGRG